MSPRPPTGLVPVTVIGGYLGAGKTTLVNRLLAGDHGRRLAVLVNDFGSISIDEALIESHDGTTISLSNGCVCCAMTDDLGDGLDQVLALQPPPEQILVEASGVADPAKIAAYGQGWPGARLHAVVTLADSETIIDRLRDQFVGQLVADQLKGADIVLCTKTDLVDASRRTEVAATLQSLTSAPLIELGVDRPPVDLLLELQPAAESTPGRERPAVSPGPATAPTTAMASASASELFDAVTIPCPDPLDRIRLERALDRWPDQIVRVKGLVALRAAEPAEVTGGLGTGPGVGVGSEPVDQSWVVQRVGRRWSIEPMNSGSPTAPTDRALVIIGLRGTADLAALAADLEG